LLEERAIGPGIRVDIAIVTPKHHNKTIEIKNPQGNQPFGLLTLA
jgi:hypothetical protein